jgi:hypothetical protein
MRIDLYRLSRKPESQAQDIAKRTTNIANSSVVNLELYNQVAEMRTPLKIRRDSVRIWIVSLVRADATRQNAQTAR